MATALHDPKKVGYSAKHDAYYSRKTGRWLEKKCGEPGCPSCKNRPAFHHKPKT